MKKVWILGTVALLVSWTGLAVDLSGEWTSGLTFTSSGVSMSNAFTLHLGGPGWRLTSSWDPSLLEVSDHSLVLKSSIGPVGVTAGASFRLATRSAMSEVGTQGALSVWSADGFSFQSGFVSFELALGNLTLRLTLHGTPGE